MSSSPYIENFLLCDTVGVLNPEKSYIWIHDLLQSTNGVGLGVHYHNDMGLALENTLQSLMAGATLVSGTFCGIGERAGNVAIEQVLNGLRVRFGIEVQGINYDAIAAVTNYIEQLGIRPASPYSQTAQRHESGIHVNSLFRDPKSYAVFPHNKIDVVFGKWSGVSNFQYLFEKQLQNPQSRKQYEKMRSVIKSLAMEKECYFTANGRAFSDVVRTWGMLILLILLIVALVSVTAFNSFVSRYLLDVITEEKDLKKFIDILLVYGAALVLVTLLVGFSRFVRKKIALDWYEWLNHQILSKYLSNRAYYKINFQSDVSNPDQQISQEIEPLTRNALSFSATCLEKVLEMTTFLIILWSLSKFVAIALLVYTIAGNLIALYLAEQLNKIQEEGLEFTADHTYSLTHVRNHAESIAFFQGEEQELNMIQRDRWFVEFRNWSCDQTTPRKCIVFTSTSLHYFRNFAGTVTLSPYNRGNERSRT